MGATAEDAPGGSRGPKRMGQGVGPGQEGRCDCEWREAWDAPRKLLSFAVKTKQPWLPPAASPPFRPDFGRACRHGPQRPALRPHLSSHPSALRAPRSPFHPGAFAPAAPSSWGFRALPRTVMPVTDPTAAGGAPTALTMEPYVWVVLFFIDFFTEIQLTYNTLSVSGAQHTLRRDHQSICHHTSLLQFQSCAVH